MKLGMLIFLQGRENRENLNEEDDYEGSGEEEDYPLILERNFEVIDFIKRLASPRMVKVCNTLLNSYDTNSETTNHCVVKMLYRIAFECKLPAMLFQASLFIKFRDILANYEPKYKELAKLAVYITRKFVETTETNKTVFVELLFPKHVKDACEIVDGYGSYQDSKNKRIAWEEHEEEELKRLDEEYRASKVKGDKVDWILDNLINKERSKRGVIKKMKELGLEIPKSNPKGFFSEEQEEELKRLFDECDKDLPDKLIVNWIFERMPSKDEHSQRILKKKLIEMGLLQMPVKKLKQWTTEQDDELSELFNEHKTDDDVMARIMAVLGPVRSRQSVVGALLRLGLVSDKSELRKKSKKSSKSRPNHEGESDDDEDEDDESDDDERPIPKTERPPPPLGQSTSVLFKQLGTCKYLIGGFKWLVASLHDNLEDLDADDFDSDVPLLPLSEEQVLSMENPLFQDFLQALGFKKPVQGQEVYWRVSSAWRSEELNTRINLLNFLVDNAERNLEEIALEINEKLSAAAGESVDVLGRNDSASEDSENDNQESLIDRKTSIKNIQKKKKTSRLQQFVRGNSADRSSSDSENDVPEHIFPQQSSISRKRYASDDSSDEENRDPANGESMPAVLRKKRTALDSDDDEPDSISDRVDGRIGVSIEESATLNGDSMAGSANRPKRNRNALDSDDDAPEAADDTRTSPQGLKKKRNFLNSDEEDERESGNSSPANIANGKSPGAAPARRKSHILDSEEEGPDLDEVSTNPSQKDSEISQPRFEETEQRSQERILDLGDNESSKCQKRPLDSDDGEMGKSVKKTRTDCDVIGEATQNETETTAAIERDEEPTIRVKRRSARKIESDDSD
ncbi:Timeless protein [Nesidiocoris tenuis]|uniref:Timeless protein n=1 Tax=Nesidiocoris tenuis TaxID=355587 RepID=A0ABN7AX57_9HEMI|nr:Timeless protein [Nesidiocoris tenuis]